MSECARTEPACTEQITIAAVFQNEAPYLREWIEFHRMMGVERFVLVDDRSRDHFRTVLEPYVAAGVVELNSLPCPHRMQGRKWPDYQRAVLAAIVDQLRGVTRWLALVDVDEFIVPSAAQTLTDFLKDYEHCGGVYVRWEPFGTSYIRRLPAAGLLTEHMRLKWQFIAGHDMLGKSIVKPHAVLRTDIHRCTLLPGLRYEDSNPGMGHATSAIKIHHYWSRDEHFLFTEKLPRLSRIKGWTMDREKIRYFTHLFNDVPDDTMKRFAPALRARVHTKSSP
jgi:hypothetical protein